MISNIVWQEELTEEIIHYNTSGKNWVVIRDVLCDCTLVNLFDVIIKNIKK